MLEVVPVVASSVILQSADHTQTELKITGRGNISPVLINPTLCGNVVLKVSHTLEFIFHFQHEETVDIHI